MPVMSDKRDPRAVDGFFVPSNGVPMMMASGFPSGIPFGPESRSARGSRLQGTSRRTKVQCEATPLILASYCPTAMRPEVPKPVVEAKCDRGGHCDQLSLQALPEVQTVLVRLEGGVHDLDKRTVVWHAEETVSSSVQCGELLCWRAAILSENEGGYCVVCRECCNVRRRCDLCEIKVIGRGGWTVLCHKPTE